MNGTTANQKFAYAVGAVYLLVGLAGFAVTGGLEFASPDGNPLLGLDVNPLHNIVHIALGAAWLIGARAGGMAARSANLALGAVLLLVGVTGFLIDRASSINILALGMSDNWLHLLTGIGSLGVAMYAARETSTNRGRPAAGM